MNILLALAFLFFMGSVFGWGIEVLFRRFFSSANPERKWINPGFCTGPYLPIYGGGLVILFLVASLEYQMWITNPFWNKVTLFLVMALCMTLIEFLAGVISIKYMKVRLWDYSSQWGNFKGLICPKFSLIWAVLGALYYFLIHPYILNALAWLSQNLAFSFFIGVFFGVFILDVVHSAKIASRLKQYAEENEVIVKYENLKAHIRSAQERRAEKASFLFPFRSKCSLHEYLSEMSAPIERLRKK